MSLYVCYSKTIRLFTKPCQPNHTSNQDVLKSETDCSVTGTLPQLTEISEHLYTVGVRVDELLGRNLVKVIVQVSC